MFRGEFRRIFTLKNIGITLTVSEIILIFSFISYENIYGLRDFDIYSFYENIFMGGFMAELILVPASAVAGVAMYMDFRGKWSYFMVIREDLKRYIAAKIINGIIFVGFIIFNAMLIFVAGLYIMAYFNGCGVGSAVETDKYIDIFQKSRIGYFWLRNTMTAAAGMIVTEIALVVVALIMNRYIAYVASYISYVSFDSIIREGNIKFVVKISDILGGMVRFDKNIYLNMLELFLILIIGAVVCFLVVYKIVGCRYFDKKISNLF